ncbi:hypothetical protein Tsp_07862 [Trichinella spiralis]|uniref:hypothetical protein n=1 Tax=Trichinella spiralis TaxID=6334 RepID=UPI0001EFB269|nr:hypothetical protein Tsp_07862 [Trichinella spiralis]
MRRRTLSNLINCINCIDTIAQYIYTGSSFHCGYALGVLVSMFYCNKLAVPYKTHFRAHTHTHTHSHLHLRFTFEYYDINVRYMLQATAQLKLTGTGVIAD